jgi:hypothetical protein
MRPQQGDQRCRCGGDDDAAFIELRDGVAHRAALAAPCRTLRLQGGMMAAVEDALGLRIGQPRQRVEEVVPIAGPRLDFALRMDA